MYTSSSCFYFLFNHTAPPEIHTLSLHDALPIFRLRIEAPVARTFLRREHRCLTLEPEDRKSTRLNSSHVERSYAGFCLKNKNEGTTSIRAPPKRSSKTISRTRA